MRAFLFSRRLLCGLSPIYMEIHPNTLAIELSKITRMHAGAKYFMKKQYIFLRLNAEDCSTSLAICANPTTRVTKRQVENAAALRSNSS